MMVWKMNWEMGKTFFWEEFLASGTQLKVRFEGLYNVSLNKENLVKDMEEWQEDGWR